ncbi:PREDICTED: calreticulin-3 isoform X2 [Hipposideros armiger]|uniref:Calreticulin-3 isoform X2 n=1 Tax=Hipposideros armiger TaxID=186990 RepID=A0A8B7RCS5_HIPAR|nr:PREDICTED: calreticulin-3 isoform X2 [Hipposideros armiger]
MAAAHVLVLAVCGLRVALATVYFQEEFLDGERWRNRWVQSTNDSQFGHFRLSSGKFYGHKEKDKGLQTTQNGRFYAISARFKPFSNKGKTLVIQYTVKHEQKMDCGGGYIKVFPADVDQKNLNGKSQYYIMFGPDICGFDIKQVHVILHFKNQYHSNKKPIRCKVDGFTHLYTLILRPDLTYEVKIDGQAIESGSIEYDWNLTSLKKMEKSLAESKDREQGREDKLQDWEKHFLDAGASKPSDWNSELDGDWQAPMLQKPPYQVRSGTIFDNFLITDDEEYAENFGKATWVETKGPEREMDDVQAKEELKRAREEDEEELLMDKFDGNENVFKRFHRRNEL